MTSTHTVFVCGATGTQGFNVARLLRSSDLNWAVHATVRDPSSPTAKRLADLGVILTVGDWDDTASLKASIAGCDMMFLNTRITFTDLGRERIQADNMLAIAKAAEVRHVVFSSGLAVDRLDEVPVYDPRTVVGQSLLSKLGTEKTLKAAGFEAWTILRGASFMENFLVPKVDMYAGLRDTNVWTMACRPDDVLPMVDTVDIAKFAVAAFQDPGRFHEKEVSIAGEKLTFEEILAQLSEVTGREFKFVALTDEEIEAQKATNPFIVGQLCIRQLAKFVNVDESKAWGIPLSNFREFLAREKDLVKETYP
ncbi:hypothetical protein B0H66DRAFT_558463 [Apodospora peruviana]|uniref:NmrA-like domain-containing protein n=1 Tax=Apodospora peruviana TaxID=516989 RepID=A0AAE0M5S5_9PEZI|nr:hypothetical protein B0H66DRAFT_558463 [Apodospora peruviana]